MKSFNFRNAFGVASVSSASIAAMVGIAFLFFQPKSQLSVTAMTSLSSLVVFMLAGFCASLIKERYSTVSILGMGMSITAFIASILFIYYEYSHSFGGRYYTKEYEQYIYYSKLYGQIVFFFASSSFVTGYISILLTTLRGYSCILNRFIWGTITMLCILWTSSQGIMLAGVDMMKDVYQYVGTVYLLALLGGVWIFVLSRMGVAEPKKWQDELFKENIG